MISQKYQLDKIPFQIKIVYTHKNKNEKLNNTTAHHILIKPIHFSLHSESKMYYQAEKYILDEILNRTMYLWTSFIDLKTRSD